MKTKHYILIGFLSLLFFPACQNMFDRDPIGLLTPDVVNTNPTLNSVKYSVNSSYQMLSNTLNVIGNWNWDKGTVTSNDFVLFDIGSDDALKKWNPDGDQAWIDEVHNYSFIASNPAFNGFWSYQYEGISRANLAISYLTDDELISRIEMDAELRRRSLGEVYFLRAFYYFDLVINFGDVPLLTTPIKDFNDAYKVAKRVDKEKIWELISDDLKIAKSNMPDSKYSSDNEPWRVSLGAILSMQAKVALYQAKYQEVIQIISELESKNFFDLNSNYFTAFSMHHEFSDKEVIFAFDHKENVIPRAGNGLCALLGWGFLAPSPSFIAEFETNDPRLDFTVNTSQKLVYKILGDTTSTNSGYDDAPNNKIYIRYADVILWKAEALIETGSVSDGIDVINFVRKRARNTIRIDGHSVAPAGTLPDRDNTASKEQAVEWLRHERRVELGFESHRLKDIRRWGIAKTVLNANGQNFQDFNQLYPIPQKDIDKSGGRLSQNTGY